jgi:predicted MFS family arabinose efflux permease
LPPPDIARGATAAPRHAWTHYTPWQRWVFLTILFSVATANYFDYFILSVLLDPIKQEFHVSDTLLGVLSGVCFALVYSATTLPFARWADRGNRCTVMTLALAGWSVMTIACGLAQSFWQLALARFGMGAFEPGALPSAQSLVADYFPPERRATALSILTNGGSAAGWLVGVGFGGYVAASHGWRAAFLLAGILSLALALVTRLTLPEPRDASGYSAGSSHSEGTRETLAWLRHKRSFVWTLAGLALYAIFAYGVMMFVPSLLERSFRASLEQVSVIWGSIMSVANILGAVLGGLLADRLSRSDIRWYAWVAALSCACGFPLYLLALSADRLWTFIGIEFLAELTLSMGMPMVFAVALAVSGRHRRAMASAVMFCAIALLGANLGPLLVGALSDALHGTYGAESLRHALRIILVFLLPAALACYWASRSMRQELED